MDYNEIPYCDFDDLPERRKTIMRVRGKAMWASVQTPNTTYDPVYCIDLIVAPETADDLKKLGLSVKNNEDGPTIKFKRKLYRTDGTENKKPVVRDAQNQPFTDLIGNGSEVIVQFSTFEWKNKFGSGISADFQGVQIVDLVPYRNADGDEFEPIEGEEDELIGEVAPPKPKQAEFDDDLPDVLD